MTWEEFAIQLQQLVEYATEEGVDPEKCMNELRTWANSIESDIADGLYQN